MNECPHCGEVLEELKDYFQEYGYLDTLVLICPVCEFERVMGQIPDDDHYYETGISGF